jgi:predicted GNAT family N-acyltransferase
MLRPGFTKGIAVEGRELDHFWILRRSAKSLRELRPRYDSYIPGARIGGITVVRSPDDFMKVAAIRAAVYMAEQACPYDEEFDGNDFASTHLIFYKGDEPAGCMRLRFFGDFAKMERLAVRKEFRTTNGAFELVRAAVELCRAKGIRKLYGHAREDLLPFWKRFGFKVKAGSDPFIFSDSTYVEMVDELSPSNRAINLESGPYAIIRPEGRWHEPGILEASAERGIR